MSKTLTAILLIVFVIIAGFLALRFLSGPEDTWICQDGVWVKHGNPTSTMPTTACPGGATGDDLVVLTTQKGNSDVIKLKTPKANQTVATPLIIEGEVRGNWSFEASFPVKLLDAQGNVLAVSPAQLQGDWMTTEYVPFKAELNFIAAEEMDAVLVLQKDNPSGLEENIDQAEVPLRLTQTEIMAVKVFYNNSEMDPEFSCNKVFPVERAIAKTQAPARAALELLLAGNLTDEEVAEGYGTSINTGVLIKSLTIEDGTAYADFNSQLEYQVGGSCRVAAISAQISQTLKQFPTVDNVVISIDGRTEDILQP